MMLALLCIYELVHFVGDGMKQPATAPDALESASTAATAAAEVVAGGVRVSTANTGKLFGGGKLRTFPAAERRFAAWSQSPHQAAASPPNAHTSRGCTRWAVSTTISEPSEGVRRTSWLPGWCTVVVADRKGPANWAAWLRSSGSAVELEQGTSFLNNDTTIYLTVPEQEAMAARSAFVALLPWNHFARKNVGFLYAIQHGATEVFDYDDDNLLVRHTARAHLLSPPLTSSHLLSPPLTSSHGPAWSHLRARASVPCLGHHHGA